MVIKVLNKAFLLAAMLLLIVNMAIAQFTITETFRGSAVPGHIVLGGEAALTAHTGIDAPDSGWLRLSSNTTFKSGYCYINQSFPSTLGVLAEFEFAGWKDNNNGIPLADGFSVFLFDASYGPGSFAPGNVGGSLGYALSRTNTNGGAYEPGLTGGYIGVGLDEFGSWSTTYLGQVGGRASNYGAFPNAVALRGPVADSSRYLAGTAANLAGTPYAGQTLPYSTITTVRPAAAIYYRKVQVLLEKNGGTYQVTVKLQMAQTGQMQTVFGPVVLATPPPANLKLGFAASTGAATAYHEVRNLRITTPGGVRTEKSGPIVVANGDNITYQVKVYNDAANPQTNIPFTDSLPAGFQFISSSFNNGGYTGNSYNAAGTTITQNILHNNSLTLQPNSYGIININGRMNFADSTATQIKNTAIARAPAGFSDPDETNDTAGAESYRLPFVKVKDTALCSGAATGILLPSLAGATLSWTVNAGSHITGAAGGNGVANSAGNYLLQQTLVNTGTVPATATYTIVPAYNYVQPDATILPVTGPPASFTVTVNPVPMLNSDTTPPAICSGSTFNYSATSSTAGAVFSWKRAAVYGIGNTADSATAGLVNETLTDTIATPVSVTYVFTTTASGCSSRANVVVPVNPLPVLSSVVQATVCSGTTFNYTATSATSGTVFSWVRDATAGISEAAASGQSGVVHEALHNTNIAPVSVLYHFTLTYNGCVRQQDVTLTVNPVPALSTAIEPADLCNGNVFAYNPASATAGAAFNWVRPAVTGISNAAASGSNAVSEQLTNTIKVPVPVTYVFTTNANGCTSTQNVVVKVNPTVNVNLVNNQTVCSGDFTTAVYFTGNATATVFAWTNSETAIGLPAAGTGDIADFEATNNSASPLVATIQVTPTANGCNGQAMQFTITVNPRPVITGVTSAPPPSALVIGSLVVLNAVVSGAAAYQWYKNAIPVTGATGAAYTIPSFQTTDAGLYSIEATSAAGCPQVSYPALNLGNVAGYTAWKTVASDNGNNPALAGDVLTYTIHVNNEGNTILSGLAIVDSIPGYTTYIPGSISGGSSNSVQMNAADARTYLLYTLPDIPAGTAAEVLFKVRVSANITGINHVANMAVVSGGNLPDHPTCATQNIICQGDSTLYDVKGMAALVLNKTADRGNIAAGDTLTFTISLTNNGTADTTGVIIRDMPTGFTYLSDNGAGSYNPVANYWAVGAVAVGQTRQLDIKMTARDTVAYRNIAVGGTLDPDNPANPRDTVNLVALRVIKTAGQNNTKPGDTLRFTILVQNVGTKDTTGVLVKELPNGFSYVSDNGAGTYNASTGIWAVGEVLAGGTRSLQITMRAEATGTYSNIAVGGTLDPVNPHNPQDTVQLAALEIVKTADRHNVNVGDTIVFTVQLSNRGAKDTTGVSIKDIPAGFSYLGDDGSGTYNALTGIWTTDCPAGSVHVLHVKMKTLPEGPYSNIAVGGTLDPANPQNPQDTVLIAALRLTKTVDRNNVQAGDTVVFTISLSNLGAKDTTGVQVKDLPQGFAYLGDDGGGTYNAASGVWTAGEVAAGAVAKQLHITMKAVASAAYHNIAVGGSFDPAEPVNPRDTAALVALQVIKTADKNSIQTGDTVVFTLRLNNLGSKDTVGVQVKDLASGFRYVSDDSKGAYNYTTAIWTTDVKAGASVFIHLTMVAEQEGGYRNIAVAGNFDPGDSSNPQDTAALAALQVVKTADRNFVNPGDTVNFRISISNRGAKDTVGVQLKELPSGFVYLSDNGAGSYNPSTSIWNVGEVKAGAAAQSILITMRATAEGNYTNIAVGGNFDPTDKTNPQDTAILVALSVVKTADKRSVNAGDTVNFIIQVSNLGLKDTLGVQVKDLPSGFSYISDNGGGTYNPATGIWTTAIEAATTNVLHIIMRADTAGANRNIAVAGTLDPADPHNPQDTVRFNSLIAWKEVKDASGNGKASAGEVLTYTIWVKNTGTGVLDTVVVRDVLPPTVTWLAPAGSGGIYTYDAPSRKLTIIDAAANIATGESRGYSFTVQVSGNTGGISAISNMAFVAGGIDSSDAEPTCTTGQGCLSGGDSTIIPVENVSVDLAINKKSDIRKTGVQDPFNYTIVVVNKGADAAHFITVTDTIPPALQYLSSSVSVGQVSYNQQTRVVSWNIAVLNVSEQLTLTINAKATGKGEVRNRAFVASAETDSNPLDNQSEDVKEIIDLFIPNVFTPNGDGKNDKFKIVGLENYPNSAIAIYNRWGNEVYHSTNYQNDWDGAGLNEGTYYYVLKLRTGSETKDYKGWVGLMR